MDDLLAEKAKALPTGAGVYLFRDRRGRVIYVGKAINLRARVRQYLAGADERFMVPFLVRTAADIEVIVTHTEKEALLLENTLIKKHQPRYNTKLTDDKNFLHLRIDARGEWPRFQMVRRIKDDGARYFGPYTSSTHARQLTAILQRSFPLRTCSDQVLKTRKRPCILHQMKRCVAPCVDLVTRDDYTTIIEESLLFLEGKRRPLIVRLNKRMMAAAEAEQYEEAARLRDLVRSIESTLERQTVVDHKLRDRDVWGLYREGSRGSVAIVPVREGMMGEPTISPVGNLPGDDGEILSSLINDFYPAGAEIPGEILLPVRPPDTDALEDVLSERRGKKVSLKFPLIGEDSELIQLAINNARSRYVSANNEDSRRNAALVRLGELLFLPGPPHRIECFDNSNIQGQNPVAAMSVLIDGVPARGEYRRYHIKTVVGADDFASMYEIIHRRAIRATREGTLPDLFVVDGGRGQVNAAMAALRDVGCTVPLVGIRKPRTEHARGDREATDKLILPHIKDPIAPRQGDQALRIVQLARDEVHKHAIRFHRKVRGHEALQSVLESIPGVGPTRRKALLTALGSVEGVFDADLATLAAVPSIGESVAQVVYTALHSDQAVVPDEES